jgi:dienelactone hydrolase
MTEMTEMTDTTLDLADGATEHGVTERTFTIGRPEQPVPGILWTPEGATGSRPLVLIGHGGTQHKRAPNILALARCLVRHHGFAAVAIDLPFHGARLAADERELPVAERRERLGRRMFGRDRGATTEQALDDWTATLDAVQALDEVGTGAVGYWGLSMGSHFGVPLVGSEPRIVAAVLGLFGWAEGRRQEGGDEQAARVTVPVLFLTQWDDEVVDRQHAFQLFGLLGSSDKTLHANPGRHVEVPRRERDAAEAFFAHHLSPA